MAAPDISVIIPVYNAMPYVTRSLNSVLEQSLGEERVEIIAVDDGSSDGSGEELDRLALEHPCLRVVHQENSGGPSHPRNVALDLAGGRYIFFLDADDHIAPEALERMLSMAEEQGSDVLLGRVVGTGGRPSPKSMFRRDQPVADLFESNVYRTLSVLKLFRRDLVERLGLRFPEDMNCGEDLSFTATAYLNAQVISVLASYECIFWHYREDGQNNFLVRRDLEGRSKAMEVMLQLVAENVEPGPRRAHLMHRHFEIEGLIVLQSILAEPSREKQLSALERVQDWLDAYYDEDVEARLPVFHRVCYELADRGRLDDLLEHLRYRDSGQKPPSVVREGRLFVAYPCFQDPDIPLPDRCFDVTDQVKIWRSLESATWDGTVLRLDAHARLTRVGNVSPVASLVLRLRDTDVEYEVACEQEPWPEKVGGGRLTCDIDVEAAAAGKALAPGLWDLYVRLDHEGLTRDGRLGARRAKDVDASPAARCLVAQDGHEHVAVSYYTDPYSNLTIDVGDTKRHVGDVLEVEQIGWVEDGAPTLIVEARSPLGNLPAGAASVALRSGDQNHHIPCSIIETAKGSALTCRVDARSASDGGPLPSGSYNLELILSCGATSSTLALPVREKLSTVRWWRYGIPYHARCSSDKDRPLTLRIARVKLLRALKRRLVR